MIPFNSTGWVGTQPDSMGLSLLTLVGFISAPNSTVNTKMESKTAYLYIGHIDIKVTNIFLLVR